MILGKSVKYKVIESVDVSTFDSVVDSLRASIHASVHGSAAKLFWTPVCSAISNNVSDLVEDSI